MLAFNTRRLTSLSLAALTVTFADRLRYTPQAPRRRQGHPGPAPLKLIHGISAAYFYEKFAPPGYKVEVVPFDSPTDGKNAVLTGTVDTCIHGIAAFILGAAADEPVTIVANANNRGMAIMAGVDSGIKSIKDLKGKKVAILPGSTQEAVILERLRMEGMTIKDIQPIRISFSDMAPALARGDIDAYVGAEPAAGITLANQDRRAGRRYPCSTPDRLTSTLILSRQPEAGEGESRAASRWLSHDCKRRSITPWRIRKRSSRWRYRNSASRKHRSKPAVPNVELAWKIDGDFTCSTPGLRAASC